MRFTPQLLPSRAGNVGIFLLNHPKPLHALTLDMIFCLADVLPQYLNDDTMDCILFKSSSDTKIPAFCAGGDVKSVYLAGIKEATEQRGRGTPGMATADFFRHEYRVNAMLNDNKTKPQISFWDGIVMGGGAGLSVHGAYRVATERALFAMPETAIGLFPDVGSMYWMTQTQKITPSVVSYIALTGIRLKADDLLYSRIATHYVPSERLDDLEANLVAGGSSNNKLSSTLDAFHEDSASTAPSHLERHRDEIDETFGRLWKDDTLGIEDLISILEDSSTPFALSTRTTLLKMSPTSLKVTLEALRRGAQCQSIQEDLRMEYRLSQACMRGHDFYEGIRAMLVDKDQSPVWKPSTLAEVTPQMVDDHFQPIDHEWTPSLNKTCRL